MTFEKMFARSYGAGFLNLGSNANNFLLIGDAKVGVDYVETFCILAGRRRILVLADQQSLVKDGRIWTKEAELLCRRNTNVKNLTVVANISVVAVVSVRTAEGLTHFRHDVLNAIGEAVRKNNGADEQLSDHVRVHVGGGAAILEKAAAIVGHRPGNAHRAAAVGHSPAKLVHAAGLVNASQSAGVVRTTRGIVLANVLQVVLLQLRHRRLDHLQAALLAHRLGAEVGVAAGAVPLLEQLRVKGDANVEVLGDAVEEKAGHPQVVGRLDAQTRANLKRRAIKRRLSPCLALKTKQTYLKLPLGGHHLCVNAANLYARIETGAVVRLNDVTAKNAPGADAAVVGALWGGIASRRPSEALRALVAVQQRVLLLQAKDGLLLGHLLHGLGGGVASVGGMGRLVVVDGLAEDENVVASAGRVGVDAHWLQVHVRVVALRLAGGAAVKVPARQLADVLRRAVLEGARLRADVLAGAVDPDVLGEADVVGLLQAHVLLQHGAV
ncbi:hypothetical protein TYRP_012001 [Tyrophagus putrescentiae]|nr:hypothetical protein TYRP_012001 [Tyrophagus putrescentiae]